MSAPARPSGPGRASSRPAIATFLVWFAAGVLLLSGVAAFLY